MVAGIAAVGLGVLRDADVVIGCLDSEAARFEASWQCLRVGRPFVDGGLSIDDTSAGAVAVFPGAGGPCYLCRADSARRRALLSELQGHEDPCWLKERRYEAAGAVATTPVMASIVGALQVERALRVVCNGAHSTSAGLAHEVKTFPSLSVETRTFKVAAQCPLHESESTIANVVERSDRCSNEWSVAAMLTETLDGADDASLCLDWPMTALARCDNCGHTWEPWLRRARFRRTACPACGAPSPVECEVVNEIPSSSRWAERTVATLGLPSLHIHDVLLSRGERRTHVFVEVTGDRPSLVETGAP
jgi:adenylyltransferase/sulfurtransferase